MVGESSVTFSNDKIRKKISFCNAKLELEKNNNPPHTQHYNEPFPPAPERWLEQTQLPLPFPHNGDFVDLGFMTSSCNLYHLQFPNQKAECIVLFFNLRLISIN